MVSSKSYQSRRYRRRQLLIHHYSKHSLESDTERYNPFEIVEGVHIDWLGTTDFSVIINLFSRIA